VRVIRLAITPSTQDVARRLPVGSAVVADHQTSGRGRLGRAWDSPPGASLLASFVLPFRDLALFAAGVAAARACGPEVRLKWPNDLYVEGQKLAGLLAERHGDRCVVGIGINLSWAPEGAAMLDRDREELLADLAGELEDWFGATDEAILGAWRERSMTLGSWVRIELDGDRFEGLAEAIENDGALIVGGRRVTVGDVVHLRPAPPLAAG
jgi:BirA family biotin operon repressor/biotin-[acetyl-CoA-carboxylase] ligase